MSGYAEPSGPAARAPDQPADLSHRCYPDTYGTRYLVAEGPLRPLTAAPSLC